MRVQPTGTNALYADCAQAARPPARGAGTRSRLQLQRSGIASLPTAQGRAPLPLRGAYASAPLTFGYVFDIRIQYTSSIRIQTHAVPASLQARLEPGASRRASCPCACAASGSRGQSTRMRCPPPPPLVLSGHAASLTPY